MNTSRRGRGRNKAAALPKHGVAVVGSLNMDLIVRTETMPQPGQTVMGQRLDQSPGGKGANQAAAAGKLWAKRARPGKGQSCRIVGRVGDDPFGQRMLEALRELRVDTSSVRVTRGEPTGVALIVVDRHGENSIVVASGANRLLHSDDLLDFRKAIETSAVMVVQLEVPYDTVACAVALAKQAAVLTILDPSPTPPEGIPESLFHVDILAPNQIEAGLLTGIPVRSVDDARRAGERLLGRGTRTVIIKMGSQGAVIITREPASAGPSGSGAKTTGGPGATGAAGVPGAAGGGTGIHAQHVPGFRVPVVDTTGAGDCFAGALATGLAEGMPLADAVRFANAAGALTCTKLGAQASLPGRAEVEKLLAGPPPDPPRHPEPPKPPK